MGPLAMIGISAGISLARWAYHRWTDTDEKRPRSPAQEVSIPRTDEGAPVPLVFGRCRVRSPILAWYGDLQYVDVFIDSDSGAFTTDDDEVPSHRVYALDMLFVAGIPMGSGVTQGNSLAGPKLHTVWLGDLKLPAPNGGDLSSNAALPIFESSLKSGQMVARHFQYGGPGAGGGLIGAYWWHGGYTDQDFTSPATRVGDRMDAWGASRIPGLARQMCVSFGKMPPDSEDDYFNITRPDVGGTVEAVPLPSQGFIFGESASLAQPSFEVSSYGDRLNDVTGQHRFSMRNEGTDFGGDADPVEAIYCLLTDPLGKLALDPSLIDTTSFAAASATLKQEGHGYSRACEDAGEADGIVQDILAQIDAVLDEEPTTGKVVIKLVRPDYDPATIPHITKYNCRRIEGLVISAHEGLVNSVRVTYENRVHDYKQESEQARNPANAVGASGAINELVLNYDGCKRQTLAAQLAARELAARSKPIIKCRAIVDRSFLRVTRGMAVKLTWGAPDISGLIFRVADVERGTLEDGAIAMDLIQDASYVWRKELPLPSDFGSAGLDELVIG